jgi:hypothetical protein
VSSGGGVQYVEQPEHSKLLFSLYYTVVDVWLAWPTDLSVHADVNATASACTQCTEPVHLRRYCCCIYHALKANVRASSCITPATSTHTCNLLMFSFSLLQELYLIPISVRLPAYNTMPVDVRHHGFAAAAANWLHRAGGCCHCITSAWLHE